MQHFVVFVRAICNILKFKHWLPSSDFIKPYHIDITLYIFCIFLYYLCIFCLVGNFNENS